MDAAGVYGIDRKNWLDARGVLKGGKTDPVHYSLDPGETGSVFAHK